MASFTGASKGSDVARRPRCLSTAGLVSCACERHIERVLGTVLATGLCGIGRSFCGGQRSLIEPPGLGKSPCEGGDVPSRGFAPELRNASGRRRCGTMLFFVGHSHCIRGPGYPQGMHSIVLCKSMAQKCFLLKLLFGAIMTNVKSYGKNLSLAPR